MTVRDLAQKIKGVSRYYIGWGETIYPFDPDAEVMMEAYGKYVVKSIDFYADSESGKGEPRVEINLSMRPVMEEATA